ncbi:DUF4124 domain-containing protein [Roseateles asaccharophilus]|uniref:DUF4124 domain-containing protein n=1 Tax=Roseateles asaccharophilus TaxID=582607 RepID=A0ABU2A807_9BURK|nr:DUF4124 domain-containing protein [Roseateles asaccharophilus]MDR7332743.1 hypothetical protein [Roseateles asaccharophilus]
MRLDLNRLLSLRLALLLLVSAVALPASAQKVFKCTDAAGKTAYQSQPCPEATQGAQLDVRWASSLPTLPAGGSLAQGRQAMMANCLGSGARSTPAFARLSVEQPAKYRSFCECVSDGAVAEISKMKNPAALNDRAAMERLGMKVGLSCAPRLQ